MHYYDWSSASGGASFPDTSNTDMADDVAKGRIPVVSWFCPSGGHLSDVAAASGSSPSGSAAAADYQVIIATAQVIKKFGTPFLLRFAWEMNEGSNSQCQDAQDPQQNFIAAWQNLWTIFEQEGVTQVAWLWNPGAPPADAAGAMAYYPGAQYVDWMGFDGYDKDLSTDHDFGDILGPYYEAALQLSGVASSAGSPGKPFLIGETGECQSYQAHYFSTAQAEIEGNLSTSANPNQYTFPQVKGFMYFDAIGAYTKCTDGTNWTFNTSSSGVTPPIPPLPAGLAAFGTMGADPYFAPMLKM